VTRNRRLILLVGVSIILVWYGVLLVSYALAPAWRTAVRERAVEALRAEFASNVRYQSFEVSLWPRVHVTARGVVIGNDPSRPLIQATSADAQCHLIPWHIQRLILSGLSLRIPTVPSTGIGAPMRTVTVDEIVAERAQVDIFPSEGQATPLHFELTELRVNNFNPGSAADFSALITSSDLRAEIQVSGRLGAWNSPSPSLTPLQGTYKMQRCDLSTVPGLKGILSAQGRLGGVLQRIEIAGTADAAQFSLSSSGRPEPLHASFEAAVDASNDTGSIQNLKGTLGTSSFTGNGFALNVQDDRIRDIAVDLSVDNGRLEDILPLAVKSATSPMGGALRVRANLEIPPGKQDILNRLSLNGDFTATNARFSSVDLRERLRNVSRKPEEHLNDQPSGSPLTGIQGHLLLNNGVAEFSDLVFDLEGVSAHLNGSYQLASERLDLHGQLWMAATLSQTATGATASFPKTVESFFRSKHGGSVVPIKVTGTRADPEFAIDVSK